MFQNTALILLLAASLTGVALAAEEPKPADFQPADFFDGLRAWELNEQATAATIWLRAAEYGDIRSMGRVAELFANGTVFPNDAGLAYFWFSQAARRGDEAAKCAFR